MNPKVAIRNETDADAGAITRVTVAAFNTLEISDHTEQFIITALRAVKSLTVSLVAEVDGRVIGHIAFSPVTISDGARNWYGLGPVSVLPEYQRQGVGKALVQEGLSRLKSMGAQGCCLVGHPDYYRKFGFRNLPGLVLEGVPQEVFFTLSFDGHAPQGTVTFHDAFKANGQRPGTGSMDPLPPVDAVLAKLAKLGIPVPAGAARVDAYGDSPELSESLLALIRAGRKRAGTSLLWGIEAEGEELPVPGQIELVVDHCNEPVLVCRITEVRIVPFNEVTAEYAAIEGEGDGSLELWREGHWAYFSRECRRIGRQPNKRMPVVCSVFEVLSVVPGQTPRLKQ